MTPRLDTGLGLRLLGQRAAMRAGLAVGAAWGGPIRDGDMALDPHMSALVRFVRRLPPAGAGAGTSAGMAAFRAQYAKATEATALLPWPGVRRRMVDVATVGQGVMHVPAVAPKGTLVYFHGGGFIMGSPGTHAGLCSALAGLTGWQVLAAPYRLAPEHPFPAAHDDARAVMAWARITLPGRLAVGGDSAGGNLAASLALDGRASFQLLLYPVVDMGAGSQFAMSMTRFGEGFLLTRDGLEQCKRLALPPGTDALDRRLSPLHAGLSRAAHAVVVVAGFDPLADQGRAYARELAEAGSHAVLLEEERLVHGFADFAGVVPEARRAVARAAAAFAEMAG